MKVLLINPPLLTDERYGHLSKLGPVSEPLGLIYLGAALLKNNIKVEILDGEALNCSVAAIGKHFISGQYDIVGITMTTPMYVKAREVYQTIRSLSKDVKIIVGGPHPTILPEETLRDNPEINIVVVGEGERTIVELVNALREKKDIKYIDGIAFRDKDEIKMTQKRAYMKNIDETPMPARELLPMKKYRPTASYYRKLPSYLIITSRGCPFHCSYCSQMFGGIYRYHSTERVIKEINILIYKYHAKEIIFRDDTFTLNKKRVKLLCNEIIASGINKKIKWSCATRVNCVDSELLKLMRKAGCWGIHYGVESGSQRLLDKIEKGITIQQIREAFQWSKEAGIETRAYFMLGLPGETPSDSLKTIIFAKQLNPDWAQFTLTTPYPGTKLFFQAQNEGTLKSKDWQQYQSWAGWADTSLPYVTKGRSSEELKQLQKKALRSFYLRPAIIFKHILLITSFVSLKKYFNGFIALLSSLLKR